MCLRANKKRPNECRLREWNFHHAKICEQNEFFWQVLAAHVLLAHVCIFWALFLSLSLFHHSIHNLTLTLLVILTKCVCVCLMFWCNSKRKCFGDKVPCNKQNDISVSFCPIFFFALEKKWIYCIAFYSSALAVCICTIFC